MRRTETTLAAGKKLDLGAGVDGPSVRIAAPGERGPKNFVDEAVAAKRDVPAPGLYAPVTYAGARSRKPCDAFHGTEIVRLARVSDESVLHALRKFQKVSYILW